MTKIQWTEKTWNPVVGCTRVSAGCDNCYAVTMTHRLGEMARADREAGRDPGKKAAYEGLTVLNNRGDRHFNGVVRCVPEALDIPLRRRKPTTWFVNSMSDLFHKDVPFEFIDRVFAVMALTPRHTYQILTKRPERMAEYLGQLDYNHLWRVAGKFLPPRAFTRSGSVLPIQWVGGSADESSVWDNDLHPNVWLGTSCEDQPALDDRVGHLLRCPAAVRFLSCEPLLGPVDLAPVLTRWKYPESPAPEVERPIGWVIVGGESGKNARPCDIAWIRSIVRQCADAGVPCFVKQLGKWISGPHDFDGWKGVIDRWLLQDEQGRQAVWTRPVLRATYHPEPYDERPANAIAWGLGDPKGGDPAEWPADLRVRQMPGNPAGGG